MLQYKLVRVLLELVTLILNHVATGPLMPKSVIDCYIEYK